MKRFLHDEHVIFTPENPMHPSVHGQNPSIEEVTKFLRGQGENAEIINGHYGKPERSILVNSPKNTKGLMSMAQSFGQDSLIHSKGGNHTMHFLNGSTAGQTVTGKGTKFLKEAPADHYSTVQTEEGPLHFQHNFDFGKAEALIKAEEHGYCTMFLFDGVDKPDILHVTHKYFGKGFKDDKEIIEALEKYFKKNPFKSFTEVFDKEEFFGPDKDIRVLRPSSNKKFLPDLKEELEKIIVDKWPEYKPHTTVSANVDCIDYPIVDYVLVKGGKVVWSAKGLMYKNEDLKKSPLPYHDHVTFGSGEGFQNPEDTPHRKQLSEVTLPNGLIYRQYHTPKQVSFDPNVHGHREHYLFDKGGNIPLAYIQTAHVDDPMSEHGYWPHAVQLSEVDPDYKGKGLGRQLYMATLLHGTKHLTSDSKISPEAHKAWKSFKGMPGLGGKIGKYTEQVPTELGLADAYESDRHQVFIKDPKQIDTKKMFPEVDLHDEKLASSELEKGAARRIHGNFDPVKELSGDQAKQMANWVGGASSGRRRDELPALSAGGKMRTTNKLMNRTQWRKNPHTNEREFLLHRQMGSHELGSVFDNKNTVSHNASSSWTPDFARLQQGIYPPSDLGTFKDYNRVVSAWIPESKIKTYIPQFGSYVPNHNNSNPVKSRGPSPSRDEGEVVVDPHSSEVHAIHADMRPVPEDSDDMGGSTGFKGWEWKKVFGKSEDIQKSDTTLASLKTMLESKEKPDVMEIPDHIQMQWAVPSHRWNNE